MGCLVGDDEQSYPALNSVNYKNDWYGMYLGSNTGTNVMEAANGFLVTFKAPITERDLFL